MHLREYVTFDGLGLAELVRRREVKPEELVQAALLAIETVLHGRPSTPRRLMAAPPAELHAKVNLAAGE